MRVYTDAWFQLHMVKILEYNFGKSPLRHERESVFLCLLETSCRYASCLLKYKLHAYTSSVLHSNNTPTDLTK